METKHTVPARTGRGRAAVVRRAAAGAAALLIASAVAAMPASASHTTHSHSNHSHAHLGHLDSWQWVSHTTLGGVHTNTFYNATHDYYEVRSY